MIRSLQGCHYVDWLYLGSVGGILIVWDKAWQRKWRRQWSNIQFLVDLEMWRTDFNGLLSNVVAKQKKLWSELNALDKESFTK